MLCIGAGQAQFDQKIRIAEAVVLRCLFVLHVTRRVDVELQTVPGHDAAAPAVAVIDSSSSGAREFVGEAKTVVLREARLCLNQRCGPGGLQAAHGGIVRKKSLLK